MNTDRTLKLKVKYASNLNYHRLFYELLVFFIPFVSMCLLFKKSDFLYSNFLRIHMDFIGVGLKVKHRISSSQMWLPIGTHTLMMPGSYLQRV